MNRINNLTAFIYQTKSIAFTIFSLYLIFALSSRSSLVQIFTVIFGQKELCHENNVVENVFITFGKRITQLKSEQNFYILCSFILHFYCFFKFFLRHILSSIFSSATALLRTANMMLWNLSNKLLLKERLQHQIILFHFSTYKHRYERSFSHKLFSI